METIPSLFRGAIELHDLRPAVARFDPESGSDPAPWSYRDLAARVYGLAARLRAADVAPGDRVAVLAENEPAFLVAYFAAPWIGAVLQPLNHRLAFPELVGVLEDAETSVLLPTRTFRERAAELGERTGVRVLEADSDAGAEDAPEPAAVAPGDLAQLYHTSGTTGRPKGVLLTHRNVCAHARAAARELALSPADRWGHFAPLFHLADAWATFAITAVGGLHVMLPRFRAGDVLSAIERERVTLTNLVPTMLTALVAEAPACDFDPSSLRALLSGGAPITPALVRRIVDVFGCEYVQTYGMTETSPYLTLSLLSAAQRELPADERLRLSARTGRPFSGVELEVVDDAGARVPADDRAVGEIRVRGASVSPGYWRNPEETAAAHRDGWLYTGDLAVVDASGSIDIVDRRKDVILTGGETVYSTEVERVLAEHAAVREVAVFGVPDETWGELVAATVVLEPGCAATPDELAGWCRARIAGFKTPRRVSFREGLPRTGSGKVAKAVLREEASNGGSPCTTLVRRDP